MNLLTRTAATSLLLALSAGSALADCDGRTGSLMSIPTPVAGSEDLPPALAELIAHHRGEIGATEVSTTQHVRPQTPPAPAVAALPPNTRVALSGLGATLPSTLH